MTENIKINPFTNKPLTASDINSLDKNQDGIITASELYSNTAFIAKYYDEQDTEGEVQVEEDDALKNFAQGSLDLLKAPAEPVIGVSKGTVNYLGGLAGFLGSFGSGLVNGGFSLFKGLFGQFSNIGKGLWGGVTGLMGGMLNGARSIFRGNILQGLGTMAKGMAGLVYKPIIGLAKGALSLGKGLVNFGAKIGKGLFNGTKKVVKGIGKAASSIGKGIANGVKSVGKAIGKIFKGW